MTSHAYCCSHYVTYKSLEAVLNLWYFYKEHIDSRDLINCTVIAKFHYTDPTRTRPDPHGPNGVSPQKKSVRVRSGPCRARVVEFSYYKAKLETAQAGGYPFVVVVGVGARVVPGALDDLPGEVEVLGRVGLAQRDRHQRLVGATGRRVVLVRVVRSVPRLLQLALPAPPTTDVNNVQTHTHTHTHARTHAHTRLTALFPGLPG